MSIDLSLHRIEALVARFKAYTRPTVHIAGTNGKGSVSALLTSIFRRAGLSVGRFNSPHLLHPSDSISLHGDPISRDFFSKTMEEVQKKNEEHAINASSFELLTVCALLVFERSKVDIVLLEVGMGGRLDATNVIPDECILASVITAIDLDHQAFLGSTIEAIAREKAGIIRGGIPVVLAPQSHGCARAVVGDVAKEKGAPLVLADAAKEREWDEEVDGERPSSFSLKPFVPPPSRPVEVEIPTPDLEDVSRRGHDPTIENSTRYRVLLPLHGPHQLGNLGAALAALHLLRVQSGSTTSVHNRIPSDFATVYERASRMDERDIHAAVRECTWSGRLSFHLYQDPISDIDTPADSSEENKSPQRHPLVVLLDGAHNEAAARTLSEYVSSLLHSLARSNADRRAEKRIRLTMILAFSHSPPKTPASVLVPLLTTFLKASQDSYTFSEYRDGIRLATRIGLLRFSSPEGMPWVRSVPPSVTCEIIRNLCPEIKDSDVWTGSDTDQEADALRELQEALHWALPKRSASEGGDSESRDDGDEENIVLIAGSLYLVADFYRLLQSQENGARALLQSEKVYKYSI